MITKICFVVIVSQKACSNGIQGTRCGWYSSINWRYRESCLFMRSLLNTQNILLRRKIFRSFPFVCFVVRIRKWKRTAVLWRPSGCLSQNFMEQKFYISNTQIQRVPYDMKMDDTKHENESWYNVDWKVKQNNNMIMKTYFYIGVINHK